MDATLSETSKIPYRVPSAEADDPSLIRPPVCIKDSCNPGGVASPTKVPCASDDDCAGGTGMKCVSNSCWIKRDAKLSCSTDGDCAAKAKGNPGNEVTRCLLDENGRNGRCIFKDLVRAEAGHVCDNDSDCGMGQCDKANKDPLLGLTYCSGGCACGLGYRQDVDTTTPLGYKCATFNACGSNPCNVQAGNGNACTNMAVSAAAGGPGYSCACGGNWTGANCEKRVKSAYGWLCNSSAECESYHCDSGQCSLPVISNSDARDYIRRCSSGQCWWNGDAPSCRGNSDVDCKNRDPGLEIIAVHDKGDGSGCWTGLKGLCAPRACEVDAQCGTAARECCKAGTYQAGYCMLKGTCG